MRHYTKELLAAKEKGATIVCSIAPYDGHQVYYRPRHLRDAEPWTLDGTYSWYRLSGRECQVSDTVTTPVK